MALVLVEVVIKFVLPLLQKERVKVVEQGLLVIYKLHNQRFICFQFTINQNNQILLTRNLNHG